MSHFFRCLIDMPCSLFRPSPRAGRCQRVDTADNQKCTFEIVGLDKLPPSEETDALLRQHIRLLRDKKPEPPQRVVRTVRVHLFVDVSALLATFMDKHPARDIAHYTSKERLFKTEFESFFHQLHEIMMFNPQTYYITFSSIRKNMIVEPTVQSVTLAIENTFRLAARSVRAFKEECINVVTREVVEWETDNLGRYGRSVASAHFLYHYDDGFFDNAPVSSVAELVELQ